MDDSGSPGDPVLRLELALVFVCAMSLGCYFSHYIVIERRVVQQMLLAPCIIAGVELVY